jgi:streptomycin 3"-adenylyltransferase
MCVAQVCRAQTPRLIGVYMHGSIALGDFGPSSDLDVLVVTEGEADWTRLGALLLADCGHPRSLELSVVKATACARPSKPWPYLLHVNSSESRFNLDPGAGDQDLISHYAVTRAAGVVVTGPPPAHVIGSVSHDDLLGYFQRELQWASEHADERYTVLNACRATAYAREGLLLSKQDGGRWWVAEFGPDPLVEQAMTAQAAGHDLGPTSAAAKVFVAGAIGRFTGN